MLVCVWRSGCLHLDLWPKTGDSFPFSPDMWKDLQKWRSTEVKPTSCTGSGGSEIYKGAENLSGCHHEMEVSELKTWEVGPPWERLNGREAVEGKPNKRKERTDQCGDGQMRKGRWPRRPTLWMMILNDRMGGWQFLLARLFICFFSVPVEAVGGISVGFRLLQTLAPCSNALKLQSSELFSTAQPWRNWAGLLKTGQSPGWSELGSSKTKYIFQARKDFNSP